MKRIYRGFKTECPTGLITEEAFQGIYSRFFPHGGQSSDDALWELFFSTLIENCCSSIHLDGSKWDKKIFTQTPQ